MAAEFRADSSAWRDDPAMVALIEELKARSPDFAAFWESHGVLEREGGVRRFHHPLEGMLALEQVSFQLAGHPDLKLTMLVPPA